MYNVYCLDEPLFRQYEWSAVTTGRISEHAYDKEGAAKLYDEVWNDEGYFVIQNTEFKSPLKSFLMRRMSGISGNFLPTKICKKVLHLSHHYGCLKDHQYICNELGLEFTSNFSVWDTILPKGVFKITREVANNIWDDNEDLFKTFDYITTSDTAPLSRIVLENIEKFDGILNIWVCNRFDYNMETDSEYTDLIRKYSDHPQVNLIPYSEFERLTNRKNITTKQETIRPIGLALQTPLIEDEDHIIGFDGDYKFEKTSGDVLVSRYHNDNIFQDSKKICESFGLTATICQI